MPTADDYALAVIAEGQIARVTGPDYMQHPVIAPRGIQIGLATVDVEAGFAMYVNAAHQDEARAAGIAFEKVGTDGLSDGLFQQQPPWWGTLAERMDPRLSAAMFFNHLVKVRTNLGDDDNPDWAYYTDERVSPGTFAQMVQQSAFPDRYDEKFAANVDRYNRLVDQSGLVALRPDFNEYPDWGPNSSPREPGEVDLWLLHTQEPPKGADNSNDAAQDLSEFLKSTEGTDNPVSYHYLGSQANDGGTTVIDHIDTDDASWSVGNSNDRSINFCFAGSRSDWTRQDWLDNERGTIAVAAYLFVQDCAKYPKLRARVIADPYGPAPGAADHNYCTEYLRDGNNHTDVGPNFPWDVFKDDVALYSGGAAPEPDSPPQPGSAPPGAPDYLILIYEQLCGPRAGVNGYGTGWPQLGQYPEGSSAAGKNMSLVDAVGALVARVAELEAQLAASDHTQHVHAATEITDHKGKVVRTIPAKKKAPAKKVGKPSIDTNKPRES